MRNERNIRKTTATIIFDAWLYQFGSKNANIIYMHKDSSATGVLKNVKDFGTYCKMIPPYLKRMVSSYGDVDNAESKYNKLNNNRLDIIGAPNAPDEADKRGRGISAPIVFMDEIAFLKYNEIVLNALRPAWKQASEFAKQSGVNYGMVFATTPGDPDSPQGQYCLSMINNCARWKDELYDLSDDELQEWLHHNSSNNMFYVKYTYKEVGKTDEWLQEIIRDSQGNMLTVRREYLLEWISNFDNSVFSEAELTKINSFVRPPILEIKLQKYYAVEFYEQPKWNLNYIVGCDVSGGLSNDSSTMAICHPDDFHVVGIFKNNCITIDDFADLIFEFGTMYFPHSIFIIERNSYGLAIIQKLVKRPEIVNRLYRSYKDRSAERTIQNGVVVKRSTKEWIYGQDVTKNVRNQMYDILGKWVEEHPEAFVSEHLYKELTTLQRDKYGSIAAAEKAGCHDDCIMAFLHVLFACLTQKYMKELFNISPIVGSSNARESNVGPDISMINRVISTANLSATQTPDERLLASMTAPSTSHGARMLDKFHDWNKGD